MMESKLPNIPKKCPKGSHILLHKSGIIRKSPKSQPRYLGYFCESPNLVTLIITLSVKVHNIISHCSMLSQSQS